MGSHLALVVGVALLGGAAYVAISGGSPVAATILVLIGASALSGWVRSRRTK
jgi:hypothetical protein